MHAELRRRAKSALNRVRDRRLAAAIREGIVMLWKPYIARAFELPAHIAAYKAAGLIVLRLVGQHIVRTRDRFVQSFLARSAGAEFRWRIRLAIGPFSHEQARTLAEVCALYLQHRFDVLGSGWVQVRHGIACAGLGKYRYPATASVKADAAGKWLEGRINRSNVGTSRRIWRLIDFPYEPIDWQLDFKSGYRWSEKNALHRHPLWSRSRRRR